uniref:sphinganine-1-phosphate aldolase n=1 Tax=Cacopsylla melanoneura TaxID=428564 RepID=A0A8D9BBI9_9HEMI
MADLLANLIANIKISINSQFVNKEPWQIVAMTTASVLTSVYIYETIFTRDPFDTDSLIGKLKKRVFKLARKIPLVRKKLEEESDKVAKIFTDDIKQSNAGLEYFLELPAQGRGRAEILELVNTYLTRGHYDWKHGRVSGAIYYYEKDLVDLLTDVFGLTSYTNPLHPDIFPGVCKMEAEVIKMVARLFSGGPETCGSMTSGGTESIMMACKAYRDYAREERGVSLPEIVLPVTAHPAFDKAANYFGMKIRHIRLNKDYTVDLAAMKSAINSNTVMLVGSVPNFPYGTMDDIVGICLLGRKYNIPVHVDCCLGGFLIPFMRDAGYPLPPFDFSLPGVTSVSVDTHKYGFAPKGSSVVLYKELKYKHCQYFVTSDWPGGNYGSPSVSGSRSGGIIATCWAAMMYFGFEGYVNTTRSIVQTTRYIESEMRSLEGLFLFGTPVTSVIALGSDVFHIYRLSSALNKRGWNINCLQFPVGIHLCVTHLHTSPGVADQFISDVKEELAVIMKDPGLQLEGVMAMYGKSHSIPDRSIIGDFTRYYIDATYYTPDCDKIVEAKQNGVVRNGTAAKIE